MAYHYILHPVAQKEFESSVAWYLKRSSNAATNFVKAVDKGIVNICSDPRRYKNEYKHYYESTIKKFPFTIVYSIEDELQLIVIIAIYHQKREPGNKYR